MEWGDSVGRAYSALSLCKYGCGRVGMKALASVVIGIVVCGGRSCAGFT